MACWIVKSEPSDYPFSMLQRDRRAAWTGIRNFQARNNLRAMKKGDLVLFFHTGDEKQVVGLAKVLGGAQPDPTAPGEDWSKVDLGPVKAFAAPVPLQALKASKALQGMSIVKQGRLSVGAVTEAELAAVLALARTRP